MRLFLNPTFRNISRLFALPFKNAHHDSLGDSFADYFMPLVKHKDFKALIDEPVKKKQEAYEKLLKCQEIMIIQQETY